MLCTHACGRKGRSLTWSRGAGKASLINREEGLVGLEGCCGGEGNQSGVWAAWGEIKGNLGEEFLENTKIAGLSAGRRRRSGEGDRGESGKCTDYQWDTWGTTSPPCPWHTFLATHCPPRRAQMWFYNCFNRTLPTTTIYLLEFALRWNLLVVWRYTQLLC